MGMQDTHSRNLPILLPAFYLPPISWFSYFLMEDRSVVLEKFEHFPKQTYRNRANIYGANGNLSLIIPMKHNGKRVVSEMEVSEAENWRKLHWKSIKNAYQSSPYFEFYEDRLQKIYENETVSLFQFNVQSIEIILKILKEDQDFTFTQEYIAQPEMQDLRNAFSAKKTSDIGFEPYYQTFSDKLGFLPDLSIIDLLCNKGPETKTYLKNILK